MHVVFNDQHRFWKPAPLLHLNLRNFMARQRASMGQFSARRCFCFYSTIALTALTLYYKVLSMTTITHFLFPAPARRSPAAIFVWWEARRLGYNAVMGVTGILALGIMGAFAYLPPGVTGLPPTP